MPAFKNSANAALPNAVVVHDKLHVAKRLNEAVDKVRKADHRQLTAQGEDTLKGTKHDWMHKRPDMRRREAASFRELHKASIKTSRVWHLKETFNSFWE